MSISTAQYSTVQYSDNGSSGGGGRIESRRKAKSGRKKWEKKGNRRGLGLGLGTSTDQELRDLLGY